MMMWVAGLIGGLGLVCMISRKTMLGLLIGVQLLILGSTMMFVLAGLSSGLRIQGHIFGLFITLGGIAQLVAGYSLAIRLFFLKKKISLDELQALKQ
jgi:NADH:ubiquinone oxidoreductase subunit K